MIACYALHPVLVDGTEMAARPVAWDRVDEDGYGHDIKGEDVSATGFQTTCPHCGALIEFLITDIVIASDKENITCGSCNRGKKGVKLVIQPAELTTIKLIDPIQTGLFKDADLSRLVPKLS